MTLLKNVILSALGVALIIIDPATTLSGPALLAPCKQDAMIVFDSSGSMSGMIVTGVRQSRIDRVRESLNEVLPRIERDRNIGLIIYGPGEGNSCTNIDVRFSPVPAAATRIIQDVGRLEPWGETPLTTAVERAAEILNYRHEAGVIVLFTDGEETCGGKTCALARKLRTLGRDLTVHVVDYTVQNPYGNKSGFKSHCLVNETGGVYVPAQTKAELVAAFKKTLGCPLVAKSNINPNAEDLFANLSNR